MGNSTLELPIFDVEVQFVRREIDILWKYSQDRYAKEAHATVSVVTSWQVRHTIKSHIH